jgi:hypothetical protein
MRTCLECGDTINPKRADLGYRTCIDCAEQTGTRAPTRCVVPLNKSNYVLINNKDDLKGLNPKRVGE